MFVWSQLNVWLKVYQAEPVGWLPAKNEVAATPQHIGGNLTKWTLLGGHVTRKWISPQSRLHIRSKRSNWTVTFLGLCTAAQLSDQNNVKYIYYNNTILTCVHLWSLCRACRHTVWHQTKDIQLLFADGGVVHDLYWATWGGVACGVKAARHTGFKFPHGMNFSHTVLTTVVLRQAAEYIVLMVRGDNEGQTQRAGRAVPKHAG